MNIIRYLSTTVLTASALLVVSCDDGNTNIRTEEGSRVELRLSSSVNMQSRADFTGADKQISDGEDIFVYVDETGVRSLYEKVALTADGNGGLTGSAKMYFPESRNNADIYAIHTNAVWSGNSYPANTITHTVAGDQRTLAGYAASDLLYSRETNVARTSAVVGLTFYHLLSKIQVAVMPGKGLTAADIKGITIGGVLPDAILSLNKETAPSAVPVTAAGSASSVTTGADVSVNFSTPRYNDAIIVPQTVAANTAFITVNLTTGYLVYRLPEETTFESGKKYRYQITANLAELVLTSSIVDWTPINPVAGSAILE